MRRRYLIGFWLLLTAAAAAQPLHAWMSDVDFHGLPRVKLRICGEQNGELLRGLDTSAIHLTENGVPQQLTLRCPDPARFNSVILVLDNSGSMFGVMPKLIEAAGRLVDSLGGSDECAIITFGRLIRLRQDFTTDKAALKAALTGLAADGGTPLFDASFEALTMLGARPGNRNAVIITDGEDNMSQRSDTSVIALARAISARLYTIAFNISVPNQKIMQRMAVQTGGSFFTVNRPSELNAVYERIAAEIVEKCCVAEYLSAVCGDSLRRLALEITAAGDTARDVQQFVSPSRSTSAQLVLDVPGQLAPFESGMGFVDYVPIPSSDLELTLSFTLRYDDRLVDLLPALPFTFGTIAQNQYVDMNKIGPGEMRFTFNRIIPAVRTPRLVGFPLQGLLADSSRRVPFSITDIVIEGCPVSFTPAPDTTEICQCVRAFALSAARPPTAAAGGVIDVPLVASGVEPGLPLLFDADVSLPDGYELIDVLDGTLLPPGAIAWNRPSPDGLHLASTGTVSPVDTAGVLAAIRLRAPGGLAPGIDTVRITDAQLWQRCCPRDTTWPAAAVVHDGICEKLVLRNSVPTMSVTPNPVTAGAAPEVLVRIPAVTPMPEIQIMLSDIRGTKAACVFRGTLAAGAHLLPLPPGDLPAGTYVLLLFMGGRTATSVFTLIR